MGTFFGSSGGMHTPQQKLTIQGEDSLIPPLSYQTRKNDLPLPSLLSILKMHLGQFPIVLWKASSSTWRYLTILSSTSSTFMAISLALSTHLLGLLWVFPITHGVFQRSCYISHHFPNGSHFSNKDDGKKYTALVSLSISQSSMCGNH